jgi:hypothetical protein
MFSFLFLYCTIKGTDSARHRSHDICPPISQIVLKNFIKISLTIKECPEEIMLTILFSNVLNIGISIYIEHTFCKLNCQWFTLLNGVF